MIVGSQLKNAATQVIKVIVYEVIMLYKIKKVNNQYGVYEVIDTGEYLVVSCNSKSNAELIVNILNADLDSRDYELCIG